MTNSYSTVGRPRILTAAQLAAVLDWQRTRKTAVQLARDLGVTLNTLFNSVRRPDRSEHGSTCGRKRLLTGESLTTARHWYRTRRTARQRAAELGIPFPSFQRTLRHYRRYKTAPPEQRRSALRARRRRMKHLQKLDLL